MKTEKRREQIPAKQVCLTTGNRFYALNKSEEGENKQKDMEKEKISM